MLFVCRSMSWELAASAGTQITSSGFSSQADSATAPLRWHRAMKEVEDSWQRSASATSIGRAVATAISGSLTVMNTVWPLGGDLLNETRHARALMSSLSETVASITIHSSYANTTASLLLDNG